MSTKTFDKLSELFLRIKKLRNNINLDGRTSKKEMEIYNIDYTDVEKYNMIILNKSSTNPFKYVNEFVENISNYCNKIIVDKSTFNIITTNYEKPLFGTNAFNLIKSCDLNLEKWNTVEVTKYHLNTKHVNLFCFNKSWYISYSTKIIKICDDINNSINANSTENIILSYLIDKSIIVEKIEDNQKIFKINENVDENLIYHFLVKHSSFRKLPNSNTKNDQGISLLWITNKNCELIEKNNYNQNFVSMKIHNEKKLHFSCLDELLTSLDTMNNEDILTKNIQYGGYYIKMYNENTKTYKTCYITTEIYDYLQNVVAQNVNQYKIFLELYQRDKLTEILPYLHKYPTDVIRRINMSVKTLAKEILNIYHLTRKKQNCELYEILPMSYKKILYNLHRIYVNQKYGEFVIKSSNMMKDKKSISVDIVYSYLKETKTNEISEIFQNRKMLIEELNKIKFDYSNILYVSNIDIITQTELMCS